MPKLYKTLWFLAILFIVVTAITFTVGIILVGGAIAGLFGIYRYYLGKTKSRNLKEWPKGFSTVEVIDIPSEEIHQSICRKKWM